MNVYGEDKPGLPTSDGEKIVALTQAEAARIRSEAIEQAQNFVGMAEEAERQALSFRECSKIWFELAGTNNPTDHGGGISGHH